MLCYQFYKYYRSLLEYGTKLLHIYNKIQFSIIFTRWIVTHSSIRTNRTFYTSHRYHAVAGLHKTMFLPLISLPTSLHYRVTNKTVEARACPNFLLVPLQVTNFGRSFLFLKTRFFSHAFLDSTKNWTNRNFYHQKSTLLFQIPRRIGHHRRPRSVAIKIRSQSRHQTGIFVSPVG